MTTIMPPMCIRCKNFKDDGRFTCKAFPEGIPDDIVYSRVKHTSPYPGDHGIMFEEKKQ